MKNTIYHGDCRDVVSDLEDNSIDLVVTSPPYNVGVDYGEYEDEIPTSEYRTSLLRPLFSLLDDKVNDTGRVCINVSLKNDKGIVDIPAIVKEEAENVGWEQRFEIVWDKGSSESSSAWGSWRSPSSPRPIFNHEYIFIYDVGEENKNSEKTISKNEFMSLVKSVWNVKPETVSDHPAPFPKEIPRRLIKLNSYEGDVVLDPFIGSGTTAVVAENLNRDWIGIELSKEYVEMAFERIEHESKKVFHDRSIMDY